jgi:hypothetical protein
MEKPRKKFETELAEIREELLRLGVRPTESPQTSAAIQKELLEEWQQANQYWLNRMQSEVALWGELLSKLTTARSGMEAFDVYAKCLAEQIRMSVKDGYRLLGDLQHMAQKLTQPRQRDGLADRE